MKKKLLFLFIVLAVALLAIGVSASDYTESDIVEMWNMSYTSRDNVGAFLLRDESNEGYYRLVIDGNGRIRNNYFPWADYKEYITEVVINDGVDMEIWGGSFRKYPALRYVKLGNGVKRIQNDAFAQCEALEAVDVSESLHRIERNAFVNCWLLREINGIKLLEVVGWNAFQGCKNLMKFEAEIVERLDNAAFRGCESLEYVNIMYLRYIGNDVFAHCRKLKEVTGMEYTEYIGINAFRECVELEKITIGEKIEKLSPACFTNCKNLYEVNILGPIPEIPIQMFRGCVNLKHVFIARSTEEPITIQREAFQGCYNLTFFANQREFKTIAQGAFAGCRSLIGINLGQTLEKIESNAFNGCLALKEIYIPKSTYYVDIGAFSNCRNTVVYAPENITGLRGIKTIIYGCEHQHFEEYLCEDKSHNHQFGSHKYESVIEWKWIPDTEYYQLIYVCPCGASSFGYELRHEKHAYEIVGFNDETHTYECYCNENTRYEDRHIFNEDLICECGYEKTSLGFNDFDLGFAIGMDHSIYGNEMDYDNTTLGEDLKACFDKEIYSYSGYRSAKKGDKISMGFRNGVRIYGIDLFSYETYGTVRIYASNENGEIVVDRLLDINGHSSYIAFAGGLVVREIVIETEEVYGDRLIISEIDVTVRPDGVKIDMSRERVEIKVESTELNYSGVEINEELLQFLKDMVTSFEMVGLGEIELDVKSINKITGKKDNVTIAIKDVTTDENAELGKRTYDIMVNDKHGNPILPPEESDENGELTLTFKFQKGFKKENIKIHYIDDNGKKQEIKIESYDPMTGEVKFKTKHLSTYEISVDVAEKTSYVNNAVEYLGYSVKEDSGEICFGFKLNHDAIVSYDNIANSALEVGIVMASYENLNGLQPLDANGNTAIIDGCNILKLNVDKTVTLCDVILTDFTEEYFSRGIVVSAYTKSDVGVTYYQENNASNIVYATVYKPLEEE